MGARGITNIRRNTLQLRWDNGERQVYHYHWLDWPDHGVPPTNLTPMDLLSCVRGNRKPIVVHCSAGIGRTGSIVAIEYILERFIDGLSCTYMDEIFKMLRRQRPYSIQNYQQYLYVHRVILLYYVEKYHKAAQTEELQRLYRDFKDEYERRLNPNA